MGKGRGGGGRGGGGRGWVRGGGDMLQFSLDMDPSSLSFWIMVVLILGICVWCCKRKYRHVHDCKYIVFKIYLLLVFLRGCAELNFVTLLII